MPAPAASDRPVRIALYLLIGLGWAMAVYLIVEPLI
jgi:hypothetical protein